jgi:hypothetical protein
MSFMRVSYSEQELVTNLKTGVVAPGVDAAGLLAEFETSKKSFGNDDQLWCLYLIRCDEKRVGHGSTVCDEKTWLEFLKTARTRVR